MIPGGDLTLLLAGALLGAFAIGWTLRGIWVDWVRGGANARRRVAALAAELHAAEMATVAAREEADAALAARFAAETAAADAEARAATAAVETEARLGAEWRVEWEALEGGLQAELREARAEAEAAMEGLGTARRRIEELEGRPGAAER